MTLTLNANGFYTCASLAADLKSAIEASYHTLQATLKALRQIKYYEGKLNLKEPELRAAARELLAEIEADAAEVEAYKQKKADALKEATDKTEDQILFHQIFLKNVPVSEVARQWADNHEKGAIVMIHTDTFYVTYASHARILASATGRQPVTENRVTKVSIPHSLVWHYQKQMRETYGMEIELIG
jgi:succinyl-CoA synthetase alpha subunit